MTAPKEWVRKQEVYISSQEIFGFYLVQCDSVLKCEADSSFHLYGLLWVFDSESGTDTIILSLQSDMYLIMIYKFIYTVFQYIAPYLTSLRSCFINIVIVTDFLLVPVKCYDGLLV
jgi:hypothetical protein